MITIIGAGPAGSYLAYLLAKNKRRVIILEEHKEIGNPIQCTGLLTSRINNYIKLPKNIILNKVNKVRIYSPNDFLELKLKNENLVVDRKKFDQFLAKKAQDSGVKIITSSKFLDYQNKKIKIQNNKEIKELKTQILIGADGPLSKTSRLINKKKNKQLIGVQARAKLENNNTIEFYPYIGAFAWIVPENKNTVRIGIASYKNPNQILKQFLKEKNIKGIIEYQGGLIPIYNPKQTIKKNNIYLIGDAASQVKATTGGGIIPSFKAAKALSNAIIKNSSYNPKKLRKELLTNLILRKIMNKFSKKDWDLLIKIFNKPKNKKNLENFERDDILRILLNLLKEPRLYRFIKYIF